MSLIIGFITLVIYFWAIIIIVSIVLGIITGIGNKILDILEKRIIK